MFLLQDFLLLVLPWLGRIDSSVRYNEQCTFLTDSCQWNIGRRWEIGDLDDTDEDDDKGKGSSTETGQRCECLALIAVAGNENDERLGFTDDIGSSWLSLTPLCGFYIRLTFLFNIENENDAIEAFLVTRNPRRSTSIGQWRALFSTPLDVTDESVSQWQQANITFQAEVEFRVGLSIFVARSISPSTPFRLDRHRSETRARLPERFGELVRDGRSSY